MLTFQVTTTFKVEAELQEWQSAHWDKFSSHTGMFWCSTWRLFFSDLNQKEKSYFSQTHEGNQ